MYKMGYKLRRTYSVDNQRGFAAIVVAITLITVLGLIAVGFAQLMRNEQRSSLDKQLSSQAFYAAEAGINDAIEAVKNGTVTRKTDCNPLPNVSNVLDASAGIEYTCIMVNDSPSSLDYGSVKTDQSTFVQVRGVHPSTSATTSITKLVFSWQQEGSSIPAFPTAYPSFTPASSWTANTVPVLRVGLVPLTTLSRTALTAGSYTGFFYPAVGGSMANTVFSSGQGWQNSGIIVRGACNLANRPYACNLTVDNINSTTLGIRLKSIYGNAHVNIVAYNGSTKILLAGAQTMIDSTGKSSDVLRRIQVRIPNESSKYYPEAAVDAAGGICKQTEVYPGYKNDHCAY